MQTLLPLAANVAALLKERKQTIAVAESSAGGLLAASLLAVPGASAYFVAGAVVYTKPARTLLMGITDEQMNGLRSSSEPYALLLARTSRARYATTWGLAETGHTCVAVSGERFERVLTLETASHDRVENMRAFTRAALELLEQALAHWPGIH
jgi:nicotinamide-nucleotide amidase